MRFTYSSLTTGRCSLPSLAGADAANSPKSADETYANSTCRSSCNATCRACAMRCGFRTHACAYVSTFSHRSALAPQRWVIERSTATPIKHGFLRIQRTLPTINSTFVTELSLRARNRTRAPRFDIFNTRRAMGTMHIHGSVFPVRKKRPRPASGPFDITKDNIDTSEHADQNVMLQLLM